MSSIITNILTLSIPLFILPVLSGTIICDSKYDLPFRWWLGILTIGITAILFHAAGVHPILYSLLISTGILGLSIWKRNAILQELLDAKAFINNNKSLFVTLLITTTIAIFGFLEINAHPPVWGDTYAIWLNKAKSIYNGTPFQALPIVQYPSIGPVLWTFIMRFTGAYSPFTALYFGPIAYLFWILSYLSFFRNKSHWLVVPVFLSFAILFYNDSITNGYQDSLLMMCAGMSALAFTHFFSEIRLSSTEWFPKKSQEDFRLGAFFAGMLSLIKLEGTVLGSIIVAACLFVTFYVIGVRKIPGFLAKNYKALFIFIAITLFWPLFLFANNINISEIQGNNLTIRSVLEAFTHTERITTIWPYYARCLQESAPLLVVSTLLTIYAIWKIPATRKQLVYLWLAWVVHVTFVGVTFLSTQAPLEWHLDTAFERLFFQHDFIYPTIIAFVLSHLLSGMPGKRPL